MVTCFLQEVMPEIYMCGNYPLEFSSKRHPVIQEKLEKSYNTNLATLWPAPKRKLKYGACHPFIFKPRDLRQSKSLILFWTLLMLNMLETYLRYWQANLSLITWEEIKTIHSLKSTSKICNSRPQSAHLWVICILGTSKGQFMPKKL